jgi:hypothetical protein
MKDLPTPKDFAREENEIGEINEKDLNTESVSLDTTSEFTSESSSSSEGDNHTSSDSIESDSNDNNE